MSSGSTPTTAQATSRPSGLLPFALAFSAVVTTTAAAPSTIPEALPAVTVPSLPNEGGSAASPSSVVSGRMWSSLLDAHRLAPGLHLDGHDLLRRRHAAHAAAARCCEESAYASCSSRVMPYFAATLSEVCAM